MDDNDALVIGKFFGAQTIVSGAVNRLGTGYRIRIRALDAMTAQVQGQFNRNIAASSTINSLLSTDGSSTEATTTASGRITQSGSSAATTVDESAPSGTYGYNDVPSWTITFSSGSFTMFVPASISPLGQNITATGVFTVSGKTLILTCLDQPMRFTITSSETLTDLADGSIWKKQ